MLRGGKEFTPIIAPTLTSLSAETIDFKITETPLVDTQQTFEVALGVRASYKLLYLPRLILGVRLYRFYANSSSPKSIRSHKEST